MKILYSPQFARKYKKLPKEVKEEAEKKEVIFRKNPFDKSLKTHKLHGRLKDLWAFSISQDYRIIFEFGENDTVYFHTVGDHKIYE
jgi:addiction module RelE/StbE family toxin